MEAATDRHSSARGNERVFRLADNSILHFECSLDSPVAEITRVSGSIADFDTQVWQVNLGGHPERIALITQPREEIVALVRDDSNETALVKVSGLDQSGALVVDNVFAFGQLREFPRFANVGDIVDFELSPDQRSVLLLHEVALGSDQHRLLSFDWVDTHDERLYKCPVQVLSDLTFPAGAPFDISVSAVNGLWTIRLGPNREDSIIQVDPQDLPRVQLANACEDVGECR
jgi:hypothetical protein